MTGLILLALYIALFVGAMILVALFTKGRKRKDFTALKTVTFGDESAVRPNRAASVLSVITILLLWVAFTNSTLPLPQASSPYLGEVKFTYTSTLPDGRSDDA